MRYIINRLAVFLLMAMWAYAAISKLSGIHQFIGQLQGHRLFNGWEQWVAWSVLVLEWLTILLLLLPSTRKTGFGFSSLLLGIFTLYIVYMFRFYPHTPCSCGGILSGMNWKTHIAFNLIFMMVSLAGLYTETRYRDIPARV